MNTVDCVIIGVLSVIVALFVLLCVVIGDERR